MKKNDLNTKQMRNKWSKYKTQLGIKFILKIVIIVNNTVRDKTHIKDSYSEHGKNGMKVSTTTQWYVEKLINVFDGHTRNIFNVN